MSTSTRSYRQAMPANSGLEFPANWRDDENKGAAVQQALLEKIRENHLNIHLGKSGPRGNGVDGDWGWESQKAWQAITPEQQKDVLVQAGIMLPVPPTPSAQQTATVAATPAAPPPAPSFWDWLFHRTPTAAPATGQPTTLNDLKATAASPIVGPNATASGSPSVIPPARPPISSEASFASRDSSGRLVASQNATNPVAIASSAKVVMLYGALDLIQNTPGLGNAAVTQFVRTHQNDIKMMLGHPTTDKAYDDAARKVGHAAATQLGLSDQDFRNAIKSKLQGITVGGNRVISTEITNFTGEGTTTMSDLSAIMYQAQRQFPAVFSHDYENHYKPETYNNSGLVFNKPGDLAVGEVRGVAPMANNVGVTLNGGTIAVASAASSKAAQYRDIEQGTRFAIGRADPTSIPAPVAFDPKVSTAPLANMRKVMEQVVKIAYDENGRIIGNNKPANEAGGWCSRGAVQALRAAGINIGSGDARSMPSRLHDAQFNKIPKPDRFLTGDTYTIYDKNDGKQHIAVYNGQQWVSDYKQGGIDVYGGTNPNCISFFRNDKLAGMAMAEAVQGPAPLETLAAANTRRAAPPAHHRA